MLPLPDNLEAVYDTQVWSMRQDYTFVGLTPHGVMEARWLVSGCEHILAIPVSLLPGQTLAEKRARLSAAIATCSRPTFEAAVEPTSMRSPESSS